ncbi:MAG: (2Fe-2S) ferredoxin domain-containing protein [Erysipelotrichaceae bacterium]
MKSLEDLKKIRDAAAKRVDMRDSGEYEYRIVVGMATCGIAAGARPVLNTLVEQQQAHSEKHIMVSQTGCIGMCSLEPIVEVFDKAGNKTTYIKMNRDKAIEMFASHIINGTIKEEYIYKNQER